jgi:DNA-binding NtrC family response regulator
MKSLLKVEMHALAYLYDHVSDLPLWMRQLTPGQLQGLANVMLLWHGTIAENTHIQPLKEMEKRYITRAISLCQGDVLKAAQALQVGKTTLYRKLKEWGYSTKDRILIYQASVLARDPHLDGPSPAHQAK